LQLAQTIEWAQVMRQAFERGARVFLQLGPGNALARMVAPAYPCCECARWKSSRALKARRHGSAARWSGCSNGFEQYVSRNTPYVALPRMAGLHPRCT
jgi:hypothetical protein